MATSKPGRKKDRNRKNAQNLRYKNERRHEKSHLRRLTRHLKICPTDVVAKKAFEKYKAAAGYIG